MDTPKVSVIIPVYKAESYIEKCARSLFEQTLGALEFIFVDDCSPDDSIAVVERVASEYPDRDGQIKILRHSSNCGVSRSRQDATDMATGEYVIHCDPDDWVDPQMYESLYEAAVEDDLDVVICDFVAESDRGSSVCRQRPAAADSISVIDGVSGRSEPYLHGSLCNKLIRRECFAGVSFPEGVNYCEDVAVLFRILSHERRIGYVEGAFYHYKVDVPGSIVKVVDRKALDMDLRLVDYLLSLTGKDEAYNGAIYSMVASIVFGRAFMAGRVGSRRFRKDYSRLLSHCLKFNHSIKQPFRLLLRISGAGGHRLSMSVLSVGRWAKSLLRRARR